MKYKKLLLLTILAFIISIGASRAILVSYLELRDAQDVIRQSNTLSTQKIKLFIDDMGNWGLVVRSLDKYLKNKDGSKKIDISSLKIFSKADKISHPLKYNDLVLLEYGTGGFFTRDYTLEFHNSEADYPGTYSAKINFAIRPSSYIYDERDGLPDLDYTVKFDVPVIQYIKVEPYDITGSSGKIKISVRSNIEWELFMNGWEVQQPENYEFKVISKPYDTVTNFDSGFNKASLRNIILAKGKPTVSADGKKLENRIIEIAYRTKPDTISQKNLIFNPSFKISPQNLK